MNNKLLSLYLAIFSAYCLLAWITQPGSLYSGPSWPRLSLAVLLNGQKPHFNKDNKIVGGEIVTPNSLPFQIVMQRSNTDSLFCGGSILTKNTIITAAHCVDGVLPSQFQIVAGEHQLNQVSGLEQTRDISKFIPHKNYGAALVRNDIALIVLSIPLDLSVPSAQPIKLPQPLQQTEVGTRLFVSGWGATSSGGTISLQLRQVMVPAISDADCVAAYSETQIADGNICAGLPRGGADACQGDSGGPLFSVLENDVPNELIGIVSWGQGCGFPGKPGVYTEVSYFIQWIETHIVA